MFSLQAKLHHLVNSTFFRRASLAMIVAASVIVGLETFQVLYQEWKTFFIWADKIILTWFIIELALQMLSYGRKPHHFFYSGWNVFDFLIVAVSICPAASPAFAVFRLLRVFRVLRLISSVPDLQILVGALLKSLPSMGYVGLLLFLIVYVYGVLGTHLFRLSDPEHFGNLGLSFLSLFQIITLEGWAEIFRPQLQIHGWPVAIYFVSFILIGTMILLNLLLGVVLRSMEQVQADLKKTHSPIDGTTQQLNELNELAIDLQIRIEKLRTTSLIR